MKKFLTTVYLGGAILFGSCVAEGTQLVQGLSEYATEVRERVQRINKLIYDDDNLYGLLEEQFKNGEIGKESFDRKNFEDLETCRAGLEEALTEAGKSFSNFRGAFLQENRVGILEYARINRNSTQDQNVALFREFVECLKEIIARRYFDQYDVDRILSGVGVTLRSLGWKSFLGAYHLFIASKYLESIDDHVNLVMSTPRLLHNMEKFHYNPVALNATTREFFPNLKTLYLYSEDDETFDDDNRIKAREVWYPYDWEPERPTNIKYHNLVLTKERIQDWFANREEISIDDWPEIKEDVALDDSCFDHQNSLRQIELPNYITRLGESCFGWCGNLSEIILPSQLKIIGECCFENVSQITGLTIPKTCTKIGSKCFSHCGMLCNVRLPKSIEVLPAMCFLNCTSLSSLVIPGVVSEIGYSCFDGCGLTSFELPTTITKLNDFVFGACTGLKEVSIPTTCKEIADRAFENCCKLTEITIPGSVQHVDDRAFAGCDKLTVINESPKPMFANDLGCAEVKNNWSSKSDNLTADEELFIQDLERSIDALFCLAALTKPDRIALIKSFVRDVALVGFDKMNDEVINDRQIGDESGALCTLARLSSLASLSSIPGLSDLGRLTELSKLSELLADLSSLSKQN